MLGSCFTNSVLPALHCTVYANDTGTPCTTPFIRPTTGVLDFSAFFTITASTKTCGDAKFSPDSLINYQAQDQLTLVMGTFMKTLLPTSAQSPCSVQLDWDGMSIMGLMPTWTLVDLEVGNTHLLVPVLWGTATCATMPTTGDGISCYSTITAGSNDTIFNCAK
jgi:hypothetical protein